MKELDKEGAPQCEKAKAYILYRFASLDEGDDQKIKTWTGGTYELKEMEAALLKLDKVRSKAGHGRHHTFMQTAYDDDDYYDVEDDDPEVDEEDVDDYQEEEEGFIYMTAAELNDTYEEEELHEAYATFQQMRKDLKAKKLGRGFFGPKASTPVGSSSSAMNPFKQQKGSKGGGKSKGDEKGRKGKGDKGKGKGRKATSVRRILSNHGSLGLGTLGNRRTRVLAKEKGQLLGRTLPTANGHSIAVQGP